MPSAGLEAGRASAAVRAGVSISSGTAAAVRGATARHQSSGRLALGNTQLRTPTRRCRPRRRDTPHIHTLVIANTAIIEL